jgi:glycosyltransferase involved in cell wall biosynthesis
MKPLVSILIPVYNREHLVGESINSAINQTYKNIEIIIVDNQSTDGTWEVLQNYAKKDERIRIFRNTENIGPVRNWEKCIAHAKGKYSKILFSDDLISENYIEEGLMLFKADVGFVISNLKIFNNTDTQPVLDRKYTRDEFSTKEYIEDILLIERKRLPVSPGCALFRTSDLKDALLIDLDNELGLDFPKFGAGNDLLIFLLICRNYTRIKIAENVSSYFRAHDGSFTISNNLEIYYEFARYYFIKRNSIELMTKYKSKIFIKSLRNTALEKIYNLIEEPMNKSFFLKYSMFFLIKRCDIFFHSKRKLIQ